MLCQLTLTVTNERLLDVCIINDYRDALINQVHGEVAQTVLFPPPPFSPTLTITQYAAVVDHFMPELPCLSLYELVIARQRITEQILFSLVLMQIHEAFADVVDVLRMVRLIDEAHVQHDTTAHAACQATERLLDAVVPVIALRPRVVSWLRHEVHIGGKGTTFPRDFCVLQFDFSGCCC